MVKVGTYRYRWTLKGLRLTVLIKEKSYLTKHLDFDAVDKEN